MSALLLAAACGEQAGSAAQPPVPSAATAIPAGATIGPQGHATILDAPPAPYTPVQPGRPQPPTADRLASHDQFRRAGEFQNRVMEEVQALADRLRKAESGNFVDLYFENEGEPHVVFRFLRDAPQTLARYTRNPRFVAATARYSMEELKAAMDFMLETFREDRVIQSGGIGNKRNRAVITINVPEEEFRALVARKGVAIPEAVELEFAADQPARAVNRPLPPTIARFVRIFPRDDRPAGPLHAIDSRSKIVLRDGCFQIAGGEHDGARVLFPLGAQLFVDREGYLAYGAGEAPGYARVGETIVTPGSIGEVTAPELVGPIHAACGSGKVVKVHGMRSAAADRAQHAVTANAQALRQLQEMYGLSEPIARRALDACKQRMGFGTCILSPPPPVRRQEDCPAGTSLSSGLCRTAEGFIRPVPRWVQELTSE